MLLVNDGKVWGRADATAIAIKGERIAAVGSDLEIPRASRIVDAGGA